MSKSIKSPISSTNLEYALVTTENSKLLKEKMISWSGSQFGVSMATEHHLRDGIPLLNNANIKHLIDRWQEAADNLSVDANLTNNARICYIVSYLQEIVGFISIENSSFPDAYQILPVFHIGEKFQQEAYTAVVNHLREHASDSDKKFVVCVVPTENQVHKKLAEEFLFGTKEGDEHLISQKLGLNAAALIAAGFSEFKQNQLPEFGSEDLTRCFECSLIQKILSKTEVDVVPELFGESGDLDNSFLLLAEPPSPEKQSFISVESLIGMKKPEDDTDYETLKHYIDAIIRNPNTISIVSPDQYFPLLEYFSKHKPDNFDAIIQNFADAFVTTPGIQEHIALYATGSTYLTLLSNLASNIHSIDLDVFTQIFVITGKKIFSNPLLSARTLEYSHDEAVACSPTKEVQSDSTHLSKKVAEFPPFSSQAEVECKEHSDEDDIFSPLKLPSSCFSSPSPTISPTTSSHTSTPESEHTDSGDRTPISQTLLESPQASPVEPSPGCDDFDPHTRLQTPVANGPRSIPQIPALHLDQALPGLNSTVVLVSPLLLDDALSFSSDGSAATIAGLLSAEQSGIEIP